MTSNAVADVDDCSAGTVRAMRELLMHAYLILLHMAFTIHIKLLSSAGTLLTNCLSSDLHGRWHRVRTKSTC